MLTASRWAILNGSVVSLLTIRFVMKRVSKRSVKRVVFFFLCAHYIHDSMMKIV